MKRVLCVLAALLLPLSVMAMTPVTDNDLSGITGQAGVTIGVSNLNITMEIDTLTYGDFDGDALGSSGYNGPGFVNLSIEDVPMHVNIADLTLTIDVGTGSTSGVTAVIIGISNFNMSLDAFAIKGIYLDSANGVATDYVGYATNGVSFAPVANAESYSEWTTSSHTPLYGLAPDSVKSLGWVGISGLKVGIPSATIIISAH